MAPSLGYTENYEKDKEQCCKDAVSALLGFYAD